MESQEIKDRRVPIACAWPILHCRQPEFVRRTINGAAERRQELRPWRNGSGDRLRFPFARAWHSFSRRRSGSKSIIFGFWRSWLRAGPCSPRLRSC